MGFDSGISCAYSSTVYYIDNLVFLFQADECTVMSSFKSEEFVPLMTNIQETLNSTLNVLSQEKQTISQQVCL